MLVKKETLCPRCPTGTVTYKTCRTLGNLELNYYACGGLRCGFEVGYVVKVNGKTGKAGESLNDFERDILGYREIKKSA